jgi:hypothetical protein
MWLRAFMQTGISPSKHSGFPLAQEQYPQED